MTHKFQNLCCTTQRKTLYCIVNLTTINRTTVKHMDCMYVGFGMYAIGSELVLICHDISKKINYYTQITVTVHVKDSFTTLDTPCYIM